MINEVRNYLHSYSCAGFLVLSKEGEILFADERSKSLFSGQQMKYIWQIFSSQDSQKYQAPYWQSLTLQQDTSTQIEVNIEGLTTSSKLSVRALDNEAGFAIEIIAEEPKVEQWFETIEEELYRLGKVSGLIDQGVVIYDVQKGENIYVNENLGRVMGQPAGDLTKPQSVQDVLISIVHPDDLPHLMENYNLFVTGKFLENEVEYRLFNKYLNEYRWVVNKRMPYKYDEQKNLKQIITIVKDVTEEKVTHQSISEHSEALAEAYRMARIGSWQYDLKEQKATLSPELKELFGYEITKTASLENLLLLIDVKDRKNIYALLHKALMELGDYTAEFEARPRNSSEPMFLQGRLRVVSNSKGIPVKLVGVVQDVTTNKHKEFEVKAAYKEASRLAKVKDDFLSVMGHELRTPMNLIMGTASLLQKHQTPPQKEALLNLKSASNRLMLLLNDMMDYVKLISGDVQLKKGTFNVVKMIDKICSICQPIADEKGLIFQCHTDDSLPKWLEGDSDRLLQIVNNLISNSLKFTVNGYVKVNIYEEEKSEDICVLKIEVEDSGIGIDESKIEQLLEPFGKVNSSINRKSGGTGIGLSIVKKLTDLHGGSMSAKGELGKGSCFTVTLPYQKPKDQEQMADRKIAIDHIKVLYADDIAFNQFLIKNICDGWNVQLDTAASGIECIEMLKKNPVYDLVLMDIQMPEMDGYEATKQIKKLPGAYFHNLPVVAITAEADSQSERKMYAAGMEDILRKPVDIDYFKNLLESVAGRKTAEREETTVSHTDLLVAENELLLDFSFFEDFYQDKPELYRKTLSLLLEDFNSYKKEIQDTVKAYNYDAFCKVRHKMLPHLEALALKETSSLLTKLKNQFGEVEEQTQTNWLNSIDQSMEIACNELSRKISA